MWAFGAAALTGWGDTVSVCLWRRRCFTWKKWRQSPHPAAAACRTKPRWQKARRSAPPASDASGTWISSFSRRKPCSESFHSHKTQPRRCQREPTKVVECKRKKKRKPRKPKSKRPSCRCCCCCCCFQLGFSWELCAHDSAQKSASKSDMFCV